MKQNAFSLVELSIVLVILGLLTGGILAGQSLIRAAELRSITADYQRFAGAMGAFRDKYFAVPGDMSNATKFWNTGTCPGTNASPSTGAATCNGNGDGRITVLATGTDAYGNTFGNELFRSWQHLANAGLIEGTYNGVTNSGTANDGVALIGSNVPRGRLSNTGWSLYWLGDILISNMSYYDGSYGNALIFGAVATGNITNSWNTIKPEEAWNIDTKMDDGKPATGSVRALEGYGGGSGNANCTNLAPSNSVSLSNAEYILTYTGNACAVVFASGH